MKRRYLSKVQCIYTFLWIIKLFVCDCLCHDVSELYAHGDVQEFAGVRTILRKPWVVMYSFILLPPFSCDHKTLFSQDNESNMIVVTPCWLMAVKHRYILLLHWMKLPIIIWYTTILFISLDVILCYYIIIYCVNILYYIYYIIINYVIISVFIISAVYCSVSLTEKNIKKINWISLDFYGHINCITFSNILSSKMNFKC